MQEGDPRTWASKRLRGSQDETSSSFDPVREQRCSLHAVDSQGHEHRGQGILAREWRPELAQLDDSDQGETFRIVILAEPPLTPPDPIPEGVAICTPSESIPSQRLLRETAAGHEMKESDVRDREEESPLGLSPQLMAALAGGQLIARPPLELSPADIFPPEETTPRLDLLARALLDQRAVEPYVRTLAVAMAAPAPTAESELRPLLLTLARILRDARAQATRFSKPLASSPQVAEALERLGSLTELMTREAFLEAVSRLYANPSDLGEDIYLCRALLDHPQEAIELARMRHFLTQAVVPDSAPELALDRTIALEQLSFACLVAEGHRLGSMRATFDRFRQRYDAAYLEHHWQYWAEAMNTHAQLLDFAPKAYALRRLNTLSELGPPLGEKALAEYEELPGAIWGCSLQVATALDLGDDARCPECGISMGQEPPWRQAQEVRHRLEKALRQQLQRLSSKAVRQILAGSNEARVEEFLRVVQASQTEALASVLDDELLGFLRRFLVEARVHSLLSPLLAKLQNISPDVSDETVEAVTEEVGRILQDAFGAAQQILPEEARPQLSPGRD